VEKFTLIGKIELILKYRDSSKRIDEKRGSETFLAFFLKILCAKTKKTAAKNCNRFSIIKPYFFLFT